MRFTIEPADHVISLEQHQDDVHICLNGELVAWFSFTGLFSFSSNYLKQHGIKVVDINAKSDR